MNIIRSVHSILYGKNYSKRFVFVTVVVIFLIFTCCSSIYESNETLIILSLNVEKSVELISRLHSKSPSLYGLKYRSLICTVVRNDPHLVEFLLRHLIIGFSHIVVYDNNRILTGYDTNITAVLAPFIAAGVVTHIPWYQNTTDLLYNNMKNNNSAECMAKYGMNADWVAILDTDDYIYYERNKTSFHILNTLLLDMEQNNMCGVLIPWSMMYGEAKILKPQTTLLDAYPRRCGFHRSGKFLVRSNQTEMTIPHLFKCLSKTQHNNPFVLNEHPKIQLIHYYSKSIEEFLIKSDQSVPPYFRQPINSYDLGPSCNLTKFHYSEDYKENFSRAYKQLKELHPVIPKTLRLPPSLSKHQVPNYDVYIHLKYRYYKRHEFDNEKYLSIHPDVKASVENGSLVDGLYHFIQNFSLGLKGCWKTPKKSFCE